LPRSLAATCKSHPPERGPSRERERLALHTLELRREGRTKSVMEEMWGGVKPGLLARNLLNTVAPSKYFVYGW